MTGLDVIRTCMTGCLTQEGIQAVTAWDRGDRVRRQGPVVAVTLRSCREEPGGFRDYLGERYNREKDRWEELYGKKAQVVFGLEIYAPGRDGAADCQIVFDQISTALQQTAPTGLTLAELSRGETRYERETGLFHCPAQAVCDTYLYAVADEGGTFVDFEVRGERKK